MKSLPQVPESAVGTVSLLIRFGLVVIGAVVVLRITEALIGRIEHAILEDLHGSAPAREKRARTLGGALRRAARGVIVGLAVLMAIRELGLDITPALAAVGGFGVAAGIGAQSMVRDMISGFFIIRDNQFAVGDEIRGAGVAGTVETLSFRQTEIRDGDGALHIVSNGELKVVTNLTKAWSSPTVRIPVSLAEDPARAIQELEAMLAEFAEDPAWKPHLLDPPKVLGVEDLSAGQFTLLLQARTLPENRLRVARALRLAAIQHLRRAGMALHAVTRAENG